MVHYTRLYGILCLSRQLSFNKLALYVFICIDRDVCAKAHSPGYAIIVTYYFIVLNCSRMVNVYFLFRSESTQE